jgi:hypothetical protein
VWLSSTSTQQSADPMGTSDEALPEHYASEWGTKAPENAKLGMESERGSGLEYAALNVGRISYRSLEDLMGKKPDAITTEAPKAIANGPRLVQAGQGVNPQVAAAAAAEATYKPGQAAIDKARDWIAEHHPELRAKNYKITDAKLLPGFGGFAGVPGKVHIDSRKFNSEREVVTMIAHELMHKGDGFWRTINIFSGRHDEIYKSANKIGEEFDESQSFGR